MEHKKVEDSDEPLSTHTKSTSALSRQKAYNDAHKERRRAQRSRSADACVKRVHTMWKAGLFDAAVIRPFLPCDRRVIGFRATRGIVVDVYDASSGSMITATFERTVNLRSRGWFALCRFNDDLLCSPIWTCFAKDS